MHNFYCDKCYHINMRIELDTRVTQVHFRKFRVYCKYCNRAITKNLERHGINNELVLSKRKKGFYTCFTCKVTQRRKRLQK